MRPDPPDRRPGHLGWLSPPPGAGEGLQRWRHCRIGNLTPLRQTSPVWPLPIRLLRRSWHCAIGSLDRTPWLPLAIGPARAPGPP